MYVKNVYIRNKYLLLAKLCVSYYLRILSIILSIRFVNVLQLWNYAAVLRCRSYCDSDWHKKRLIKHAGGMEFSIGRPCFAGTKGSFRGSERLSSLTETRPSIGNRENPRVRFVILYTTVSKEWRLWKALSEIPTLRLPTYLSTYLAIPTYARARILSGCLHRNTAVVIVLEMVAIFARSRQEDNETRPDTRYTTTLSWFSLVSLLLSLPFSIIHNPPFNLSVALLVVQPSY